VEPETPPPPLSAENVEAKTYAGKSENWPAKKYSMLIEVEKKGHRERDRDPA